jgi:hypothetical protein
MTDVSGQRIGQIVKGQSVQISDSLTIGNKTDRYLTTDLPCVTAQKSEDLKLHQGKSPELRIQEDPVTVCS